MNGCICCAPTASFSVVTPLVWSLGPLMEVAMPLPCLGKSCSVEKLPQTQASGRKAWPRNTADYFLLPHLHFHQGGGSWADFSEWILPISETEVKDAK